MTLFVACECPDPWAECKCPPFTEEAYRKEVAVIVDTLADFDTDTLSACERQGPHGQSWAIVEADRAMKLLRQWSRLLDRLASVVSTYPADAGGFGVRIHSTENLLLAHEYLALAETATRVRRAVLDYLIGDSGPATAVEPWVQFSNGATIELWPRAATVDGRAPRSSRDQNAVPTVQLLNGQYADATAETALDMVHEAIGHVQAAQSDPRLYDILNDLMKVMELFIETTAAPCVGCGANPDACSWSQNPGRGRGDCCASCNHGHPVTAELATSAAEPF